MAQDVTIAGAAYSDVPSVVLPKTGGGAAVFADPSGVTAAAEDVRAGKVFLGPDGQTITGTAVQLWLAPIAVDYEPGYVSGASWTYQNSVNNHSDVYEVVQGRRYMLGFGHTVGTRFRAVVTAISPVGSTSNIGGTQVINRTNPAAQDSVTFVAGMDGFLTVTKDNVGVTGIPSYVADVTAE